MVLARVIIHVLARVLPHVLARASRHVLAYVIIHVHDYYSKTCVPGPKVDKDCVFHVWLQESPNNVVVVQPVMPVKGIVARISYKNTFQKPGDGHCFHDKVISQVVAKLVNSHISQTHLPKLHSQVHVPLIFGRLTCIFAKSFRKGGLL